MQSRQTLLEQFSTFATLSNDRFEGWSTDPRLQRSMSHQLALAPEAPESAAFWSIYWHQCYQEKSHRSAEWHLMAYLQESCYWVSLEISRKMVGLQSQASTSYTTADYFQMAMAKVPLALQKFKPEKSHYLKAFSQVFLSNQIKSILRQQGQADFCSLWGLLKKTSRKCMLNVLDYQGVVAQQQVEQYRLLWMGFQALYVAPPGTSRRAEPKAALWEEIAQFYNSQRLGQLSQPTQSVTSTEVESQLRQLAKWIRAYHYPNIESTNKARFDDEGQELQDTIFDENQRSLIDNCIQQEAQNNRSEAQAKLQQILTTAFSHLDSQSQRIVYLLYGQGLSQQTVMLEVKVAQPTVSRRLKKAKIQLLESILEEIGPGVNNFPEPDQLKVITTALEEWLKVYLRESNLCE